MKNLNLKILQQKHNGEHLATVTPQVKCCKDCKRELVYKVSTTDMNSSTMGCHNETL